MLADNIEVTYDKADLPSTDETPTFGIIADGRTFPAVSVRRRQHKGSRRATLYTVSRNGKFAEYYDDFNREYIQPYQQRKEARQQRKPENSSGAVQVNSVGTARGGNGKAWAGREWEYRDSVAAANLG